MAPSAERQQVQDTKFAQVSGERAAYAKPYTRPAPSPKPTPVEKSSPDRLKRRQADHRAIVQNTVGLASVAGLISAMFLYGHVQLAREAQRSVIVSEMLNQQIERSRILTNAQAKDVTPTSINQKASLVGMVHPEEKDTIIVP